MPGKERKSGGLNVRCQSPSIIPRNRTIDAPVKSYPGLQAFLT